MASCSHRLKARPKTAVSWTRQPHVDPCADPAATRDSPGHVGSAPDHPASALAPGLQSGRVRRLSPGSGFGPDLFRNHRETEAI